MSGRRSEEGDTNGTGAECRALDAFFASKYQELRRLAAGLKRGDANVTINPTALVNEAWLRLAGVPGLDALSPSHFKAIAARAMRRVLIDAARRRRAHKRGGAPAVTIAFDDTLAEQVAVEDDLLGLDAAIRDLARMAPRQARLVEGRYFGGLTVAELSEWLNVSETTVEREWRAARAWLKTQLRGPQDERRQGRGR